MMWILPLLLSTFITTITAQPPQIWPLPQYYSNGAVTLTLDSTFHMVPTPAFTDIVHAISRYNEIIFPHKNVGTGTLKLLTINISNPSIPLQLYVDESYQLTIPTNGGNAVLQSATYWGALRGLETFSQLVRYNFTGRSYEVRQAPWVIHDAPRFPHRGILLDTSRHFEPVRTIKTFIDSLTYAKFNTFHWHLVDSQSFPFESKKYPAIWNGAYSEFERYSQEDVAEVVEFARQRGVRVIVEFDLPGHADSWCTGYPDICPSTTCTSPVDPSSTALYDLMNGVFSEVTGGATSLGLFPDNYIHLGGDEVDTSCWTQTPHIVDWLKSKNFTAHQAYMYVVEQAHQIVLKQGRQPINWEEVYTNFGTQLDKSTIVHVWIDFTVLNRAVADGYRAILSNQDVWYLDHLDTPWENMYLNEPFLNITDPAQQKLVLGGEGCMWGETVDTSDIGATVWPRAAAIAERLWSPQTVRDTTAALPRLEYFRCLLNQRGIAAAPVNNKLARQAPPGPGGCYVQ